MQGIPFENRNDIGYEIGLNPFLITILLPTSLTSFSFPNFNVTSNKLEMSVSVVHS